VAVDLLHGLDDLHAGAEQVHRLPAQRLQFPGP
jgi:hypothetical protein